MTAKIPACLEVYDLCLKARGWDLKLAKDAAKDILISTKALKDRQTVETTDDSANTDTDLIAEAERIIVVTGSKTPVGTDNV